MEEDATDIDWVPVMEALVVVEAEIIRGYLESNDIPVQVRRTRKITSPASVYYFSNGMYIEHELWVKSVDQISALDLLDERDAEEESEKAEGKPILVYDMDRNILELALSEGVPCPSCSALEIEHMSDLKWEGSELFYLYLPNICFQTISGIIVYLIIGASWPVAIIGIVLTAFMLFQSMIFIETSTNPNESWSCENCDKMWWK